MFIGHAKNVLIRLNCKISNAACRQSESSIRKHLGDYRRVLGAAKIFIDTFVNSAS